VSWKTVKDQEKQWKTLAGRQHGVVSVVQLHGLGLSSRQITVRVRTGALVRVHHGVYRVTGAPQTFEQAVMAACLASGGVSSHRAAAVMWQLRGQTDRVVEVTGGRSRRAELRGAVTHSSWRLERSDITVRCGIPVTTPARTLLDLGAVVAEREVEMAVEDALHRRLVTYEGLVRQLHRSGARGRNGTAVLRAILGARDPCAAPTESLLEDELVRVLRRGGLPEPVRQHWVRVPGQAPVRLDLAYPDDRIAIEAQSVAWHAGKEDLQRTCRKRNLLAALRWCLLEFTWEDVNDRPDLVCDTVSRARLAAAVP
jgi:hypothetical protein